MEVISVEKQKRIRIIVCSIFFAVFILLDVLSVGRVNAASGTWHSSASGWWFEYSGGGYASNSWVEISGYWYYFTASGYMDYSEYRDGCWLNSDGTWDTSYSGGHWASDSKGWWYTDTSGWYPVNQWVWIDGSCYYFKANGYMAADEYIDGCYVESDGAWNPNHKYSEDVNNNGMDEYTYVVSECSGIDGYTYSLDHDIENGIYHDGEVPFIGDLRHPEYRFLYPGGNMSDGSKYLYRLGNYMPYTTKRITHKYGYDNYYFEDGRISKVDSYNTSEGVDNLSSSSKYKTDVAERRIVETRSIGLYLGGADAPSGYKEFINTYYYSEGGELLRISGDEYDAEYTYEEIGDVYSDYYDFRLVSYKYTSQGKSYRGTITYDSSYSTEPKNGYAYVKGTGLPYGVNEAVIHYKDDFCQSITLKFPNGKTETLSYKYKRVKIY